MISYQDASKEAVDLMEEVCNNHVHFGMKPGCQGTAIHCTNSKKRLLLYIARLEVKLNKKSKDDLHYLQDPNYDPLKMLKEKQA